MARFQLVRVLKRLDVLPVERSIHGRDVFRRRRWKSPSDGVSDVEEGGPPAIVERLVDSDPPGKLLLGPFDSESATVLIWRR